MLRTSQRGWAVFLSLAMTSTAFAQSSFIATTDLSADNELHVVTGADDAEGSAQFVYDDNTGMLHWVIVYTGMTEDPTGGHIHGPADEASTAGVILNLLPSSTSIPFGSPASAAVLEGNTMPSAMVLDTVITGLGYVNLHTTMNGAGEMRGQLAVQTSQTYAGAMDPGQETGAVMGDVSLAMGESAFTYEPVSNTLSWVATYSGLTGPLTGAHIHSPAGPGANAGVTVDLLANGTDSNGELRGSVTAPDPGVLQALFSGRAYINLHTATNSGGEIRGQLGPILFSDGLETPVVSTSTP